MAKKPAFGGKAAPPFKKKAAGAKKSAVPRKTVMKASAPTKTKKK